MKQIPTQNQAPHENDIELLMDQISAYRDSDDPPPAELMNRYRSYVEASDSESERVDLALSDAYGFRSQGRYCEALVAYERALQRYPQNLVLQKDWLGFISMVANELEKLGRREPSHAELGRTYDRLISLGCVPLGLHFTMIHHYRLIGELGLAGNLALKLQAVAPSYPGLNEALKKLQTEDYSDEIA